MYLLEIMSKQNNNIIFIKSPAHPYFFFLGHMSEEQEIILLWPYLKFYGMYLTKCTVHAYFIDKKYIQ